MTKKNVSFQAKLLTYKISIIKLKTIMVVTNISLAEIVPNIALKSLLKIIKILIF